MASSMCAECAFLVRVQDKRSSVGIVAKRSSVWMQLKSYIQFTGYLQERILFLNISNDGDWTASSEREFQSLMVLGKKEFSEYAVGVSGMMYDLLLFFLDGLFCGFSCSLQESISTSCLDILYNIARRYCFLLVWRLGHLSRSSIDLTELLL